MDGALLRKMMLPLAAKFVELLLHARLASGQLFGELGGPSTKVAVRALQQR